MEQEEKHSKIQWNYPNCLEENNFPVVSAFDTIMRGKDVIYFLKFFFL